MTRIRFEDLPSTNTPRNAENLNKLNNVVISPTMPSTGEEVWIQKGKNLFNKNNVSIGYLNADGSLYNATGYRTSDFIPIAPNTTYYKTKTDSARAKFYDINKQPLTDVYNDIPNDGGAIAFTTPANAYYLRVTMLEQYVDTLQIEQGSTGTAYEPYINKKIYTKNDNDSYEEFYNEENLDVYSTGEQRIGTWLGKPLYRKVITFTMAFLEGANYIEHGISNIKNIIRKELVNGDSSSMFPFIDGTEFGSIFKVNDTQVVVNCVNGTWAEAERYIILEYTKTTD